MVASPSVGAVVVSPSVGAVVSSPSTGAVAVVPPSEGAVVVPSTGAVVVVVVGLAVVGAAFCFRQILLPLRLEREEWEWNSRRRGTLLVLVCCVKKHGGILTVKGKRLALLGRQANYLPVILSCVFGVLALAACLVLGNAAAFYLLFGLLAWLLVLLVYYTVKLM